MSGWNCWHRRNRNVELEIRHGIGALRLYLEGLRPHKIPIILIRFNHRKTVCVVVAIYFCCIGLN